MLWQIIFMMVLSLFSFTRTILNQQFPKSSLPSRKTNPRAGRHGSGHGSHEYGRMVCVQCAVNLHSFRSYQETGIEYCAHFFGEKCVDLTRVRWLNPNAVAPCGILRVRQST